MKFLTGQFPLKLVTLFKKYASTIKSMILYQSGHDKMAFHCPLFNNYFMRFAKKVDFGNACCLILGI